MSPHRAVLALVDHDSAGRAIGHRIVDPETPQLHVTDLAAQRGDGVFETISVGRGRPQALEPHLLRFGHSAAMLDLPSPELDLWRAAIRAVAAELSAHEEAFVKIVLSRGEPGASPVRPTGWLWGEPSPDHGAARRGGIRVVTLDRGYRHDVARTSPWLLTGSKSLSYAVNMAAIREAKRRGADDALFVSADGYLLEGPVSNLILRIDGRLVTPRSDLGILVGTTQADVFRHARGRGVDTGFEMLTRHDLPRADAAWLVSSVRHAAPLSRIDDLPIAADRAATDEINDALRARTE